MKSLKIENPILPENAIYQENEKKIEIKNDDRVNKRSI